VAGIHTYGRQSLDDDDRAAVRQVLDSDFLTQGPAIPRFEEELCRITGARNAVAVANGTAALHLACLAGGLGPGKAAVTSAITFVASANAPLYCNGETLLADIDPTTCCLSPAALGPIMAKLGKVDAVIPVHYAGLSADVAEIRRLVGSQAIIIEDAAHSLGGTDEAGNPVGSCAHSDMAILSFHPVKTVTTGEGGAVLTNNDELANRLRLLRSHGTERDPSALINTADAFTNGSKNPWYYEQQLLGFNYRMTDLQAALGASQLKKLPRFIERRGELARRYDRLLSGLNHVVPIQSPALRERSANHLYVVTIDFKAIGVSRAALMQRLLEAKVGCQVHYIPVYRHPLHASRGKPTDFPASEAFYERCLSLPLHPALDEGDIARVVDTLAASCRP
jgi:UDP-4-amino-4,6-dideoxy-N-acetyl-beta-L-altrosamine transaminase